MGQNFNSLIQITAILLFGYRCTSTHRFSCVHIDTDPRVQQVLRSRRASRSVRRGTDSSIYTLTNTEICRTKIAAHINERNGYFHSYVPVRPTLCNISLFLYLLYVSVPELLIFLVFSQNSFFLNHEFLIWIYFAQYHIETDFFRNEIFNVRSMLVEDRHTNELRNGFFIDVITVLEYSVLKGSASISTRPKIWPDMTEGARKSGKKWFHNHNE